MIGIIPAAGKGTRLKELGRHYSKCILPYKERPLLIHQIEWLEDQGCTDIRVVLNHQEADVRLMLAMYNKNPKIYIQESLNGLSGAILTAIQFDIIINNDSVLICLGDIIPKWKTSKRDDLFNYNFVSVQEVDDYSRWCMVKCSHDKPLEFIDKPLVKPDTKLALSGVYFIKNYNTLRDLLMKQIMGKHKKHNEYEFSYVLSEIASYEYMTTVTGPVIDFGTLNEYLENKGVKKSRSFNNISVDERTIIKSSNKNQDKIRAEVNWFKDIPLEVQTFTPRIYAHNFYMYNGAYEYTMEKILAPTLREIYLFLDSSRETWEDIFNTLFNSVLFNMSEYDSSNNFMNRVIDKTIDRSKHLNIHVKLTEGDSEIVENFLENTIFKLREVPEEYQECLMHGDFCFSNILYDLNSNKVTLIDPRGELRGNHYYDVAKLYHSVICDYDFVDAELYSLTANGGYILYNKGKENVKEVFLEVLKNNYSLDEIKYIKLIVASLFLSMIPLHDHNKNNQKIYFEIFKGLVKEL